MNVCFSDISTMVYLLLLLLFDKLCIFQCTLRILFGAFGGCSSIVVQISCCSLSISFNLTHTVLNTIVKIMCIVFQLMYDFIFFVHRSVHSAFFDTMFQYIFIRRARVFCVVLLKFMHSRDKFSAVFKCHMLVLVQTISSFCFFFTHINSEGVQCAAYYQICVCVYLCVDYMRILLLININTASIKKRIIALNLH